VGNQILPRNWAKGVLAFVLVTGRKAVDLVSPKTVSCVTREGAGEWVGQDVAGCRPCYVVRVNASDSQIIAFGVQNHGYF